MKIPESSNIGKVIGSVGSDFPEISINGYRISTNELKTFEINMEGWIPTVNVTFKTNNPSFRLKHLPHDGDLISVYIRPDNDMFRPIKADFLITTFDTNFSQDKDGAFILWSLNGILNIPLLYKDYCKSYSQKTSFEVFLDFVNEQGLGFVTNVEKTEDKMTWINAQKPNSVFLQEVCNHAYLDEFSFFDSWIDWYYNLNFIEVNKILSVPDNQELREGVIRSNLNRDWRGEDEDKTAVETLILTNAKEFASTNGYFRKFSYTSQSGLITSIFGYKKNMLWYDEALKTFEQLKLMTTKTSGAEENKIIGLGRVGDTYYKKFIKHKWLGIHFNKNNTHPAYHIAEIQNFYNLLELKKLSIKIEMGNINMNVYKGMMIQVNFVMEDEYGSQMAGNPDDEGKVNGFSIDRSLSGNYYLSAINLRWTQDYGFPNGDPSGSWHQELILGKREWTMPTDIKFPLPE